MWAVALRSASYISPKNIWILKMTVFQIDGSLFNNWRMSVNVLADDLKKYNPGDIHYVEEIFAV